MQPDMTKRLPASQRIPRESDAFLSKLLWRAEQSLREANLPSRPDPEQVAILKQGAAAWNRWRRDFPNVVPNLAHLDIRSSFADLRGVNLIGANLYKTLIQGDVSRSFRKTKNRSRCFATCSRSTATGCSTCWSTTPRTG
jgi:hypothetical protein